MLGILRFFLASCVVVFHMSGHAPVIGVLAVNCFYVISGYLMTLVLNETYRFDPQRFFANRFLRLYPAQIAICAFSLPFIWGLSKAPLFHPMWGAPQWQDWAGNALIFPWTFLPSQHFRISPTTWSVAVEIWCYFFLWLLVSRRPWTAVFTAVLAALWQVYLFRTGADEGAHYYPVSAALLPFSLGAASYFAINHPLLSRFERKASSTTQFVILFGVVAAFLANWQLAVRFDASPYYGVFYYLNTVVACLAVIALHDLRPTGIAGRVAAWCGDLSYPMFLAQWVATFIAWHIIGTDTPTRSWSVFSLGYALSVLIGIATVVLVDRPIHRVRNKIRLNAKAVCLPRSATT
jgi:peptidoglycan/LPS O-acetylase OafA/YrhL